jgi:protein O-GlcNAc transferase
VNSTPAGQIDWLFRAAMDLHERGQLDRARVAFERILELDPKHGRAAHSLGFIAMQRGNYAAALVELERAAKFGHDTAQVENNWGVSLRSLGRHLESISHFRKAAKLEPEFAQAWGNLGEVLLTEGDAWEANEALRRALTLAPELMGTRQALIFSQNYMPDIDPSTQTRTAKLFGEFVAKSVAQPTTFPNHPDPDRQLKVGLVSGDLANHSVPRFLLGFLGLINRDGIEFHAYSNGTRVDEVTERLKSVIPKWTDIHGLDDTSAAQAIAGDEIDVLFDLAGFTASNRLPIFGHRPAPVAATWLGYSGTTGMPGVDYVLSDPVVAPVEEEQLFSERPWRLPDAYLCFTPPRNSPEVSPPPVAANGQITFGSFNSLNKLNDRVIALWAEVLAAVPLSRLIIKSSTTSNLVTNERVLRQFAEAGFRPEQLIVLGYESSEESHLSAYGKIDIALDPFPYNGTTTTCEALFMGVPVITLRGDRFIAHVGESILRTAGLPHLVAKDHGDYVRIARELASDINRLAADRATLRDRFMASPMCDAPRFARNFEAAVRGMWRAWCATQGRA